MLLVGLLASCGRSSENGSSAKRNDSLERVVAQKDSVINDVFASMNAVAENLSAIKLRENIINASLDSGEIPKQSAVKIDRLLQENRRTINRLQQSADQLKKANVRVASLEKLIAQLQSQVESKDQEIVVLRKNLENMNVQVAQLSEQVTGLHTQVSDLSEEKASLEGDLKTQSDILNTGYYMVGPEKELLQKEIVYKSGFIGRTLKINENRSLESFTQIDIRNFDGLKIGHRKAVLVSSHPAGSYEFVMNADGVFEELQIKDKTKFWEYSKVLVVSYKP